MQGLVHWHWHPMFQPPPLRINDWFSIENQYMNPKLTCPFSCLRSLRSLAFATHHHHPLWIVRGWNPPMWPLGNATPWYPSAHTKMLVVNLDYVFVLRSLPVIWYFIYNLLHPNMNLSHCNKIVIHSNPISFCPMTNHDIPLISPHWILSLPRPALAVVCTPVLRKLLRALVGAVLLPALMLFRPLLRMLILRSLSQELMGDEPGRDLHYSWVISHVPIEHHPTIRYMVYNGYYKVMSNIPKMGYISNEIAI